MVRLEECIVFLRRGIHKTGKGREGHLCEVNDTWKECNSDKIKGETRWLQESESVSHSVMFDSL